ncbi:hypothetical protein AYI68_g2521 [Smittium mucronatum]|uniref:Uncharacterized protein n=1 Tax=Smittium mucronatum TaxID=133383 RepID=A0A1R0H2G2_9FUNG|nr:hypothetical protein AYI68_g2521 [Smittium mucronatum]
MDSPKEFIDLEYRFVVLKEILISAENFIISGIDIEIKSEEPLSPKTAYRDINPENDFKSAIKDSNEKKEEVSENKSLLFEEDLISPLDKLVFDNLTAKSEARLVPSGINPKNKPLIEVVSPFEKVSTIPKSFESLADEELKSSPKNLIQECDKDSIKISLDEKTLHILNLLNWAIMAPLSFFQLVKHVDIIDIGDTLIYLEKEKYFEKEKISIADITFWNSVLGTTADLSRSKNEFLNVKKSNVTFDLISKFSETVTRFFLKNITHISNIKPDSSLKDAFIKAVSHHYFSFENSKMIPSISSMDSLFLSNMFWNNVEITIGYLEINKTNPGIVLTFFFL